MAWQRLGLVVAGECAQALADALEAEGALSTDLSDADAGTEREEALFGEPGADGGLWPRCRLTALFDASADVSAALDAALAAAGTPPVQAASLDRLEDADWVALTQKQFEPMRVGDRLWIVPTWHEPPDPRAVNIVLDPGAAFGTGSHPTTRLCLAWLERSVRPGDAVLDYGCGSGILAIAAMKLGGASAIAVDVDPLALEAARYNASRNDVRLAPDTPMLATMEAWAIPVFGSLLATETVGRLIAVVLFIAVLNHDQPNQLAHLRRSQTDPRRIAHGVDHALQARFLVRIDLRVEGARDDVGIHAFRREFPRDPVPALSLDVGGVPRERLRRARIVEVCEALNRLTPGDHEKRTALFNSGAEAVENAVKIARCATGRQAVVAFDHAYHGRTSLTMAMTAKVQPYKQGFGPFAPEIYRAPLSYPFRDAVTLTVPPSVRVRSKVPAVLVKVPPAWANPVDPVSEVGEVDD